MSSFLGVPVDAAYHLVSGLTGILTPVLGGLAAVAAIVVFTMAVRLLLMPLSLRALRGQAAQARLAPQWPFLSVMYLLFRSPTVGGTANTLLSHDLLGVPLGAHWLSGAGAASAQGAVFLGLFALLAGLCWLSARLGRLMAAQATAARPAKPAKSATPGKPAKSATPGKPAKSATPGKPAT